MPAANPLEPSVVSASVGILPRRGLFWNMISKWVLQSSAVTSGSLQLAGAKACSGKELDCRVLEVFNRS